MVDMLKNERPVTVKQIAHILGENSYNIYNWVATNKIPYHRNGCTILFYESEIEKWLVEKEQLKKMRRQRAREYYDLRDDIKYLLQEIVRKNISKTELEKIYEYISGLKSVQQIRKTKSDDK